jgi:biopolymer transport protein TolQ
MYLNSFVFLGSNPFFDAYLHSDMLGRLIILSLILLSVVTWVILIHKTWITYGVKKQCDEFQELVDGYQGNFLAIKHAEEEKGNHFFNLYSVLKKQTVDLLNKNRRFALSSAEEEEQEREKEPARSYLSPSDIDIVESHLATTIASQTKMLEKNLYILATVVPLAPFLGLLGTVWGILTSFGQLQAQAGGNTSQLVLGGLSLALATTVIGLVDAIPALIGHNYLKNTIREHQTDMECFSNQILASVEMQYRKVDVL